ncbi:hypothetical protein ACFYP4_22530 [Streptomyces sp. NPDC005551]|uniref:hypothetical protein n=1 Tax=unclassified Streptomyces TaxID=2593676 RepID=UPI003411D621
MYEMHAEAMPGLGGLVWHVISKGTRASALCGRRLASPVPPAGSDGETPEERYCSSCMAVVGSAVASDLRRQTTT